MALTSRIGPALWLAAITLLLTPLLAYAFSLGEIEVTGSYKKQFSARIPAYVDGQEGLEVEIGNVADYIKVGVRRPRFIDDLSLIVADHPSLKGAKLIQVISPGPIDTPSFNLVVKAKLGSGRVMENYFLAVDFQRKLAVKSEPAPESNEDLMKIAEEMRRMREGIGPEPTPQPGVEEAPKEKADDMIARMREEERRADHQDRRPDEPAPARAAEQALLEKMRKEEMVQSRPVAPTPTPTPEAPQVLTNDTPAKPNEPGTIVVTGDAVAPAEESPVVADAVDTAPPTSEPGDGVDIDATLPVTLETGGSYTVSRGDTLSELAFAAGNGMKMTPQLVVALWKLNQSAFIGGNVHGVRAGATLSFAGVIEEATRLTRTEAAKILATQWDEWLARTGQSTTVTAAAPSSEPSTEARTATTSTKPTDSRKIAVRSAALSILTSWRDAGKVEGLDLDKATMGERAGNRLEVTAPKKDDPTTSVTLVLKRNPDGTLTVIDRIETKRGEKVVDDPKAARRYMIHVASYKDQGSARRLIGILRRKGYDAYETGGDLAGNGAWHRVAVGRFGDREAGFAFARALRADTGLGYTRLLDRPYAVQIGLPTDTATALATIDRLEGDGHFGAYLVDERGGEGLVSVMMGAFSTPKRRKRPWRR